MEEDKIKIELSEDELVAIMVAVSQASCGYDKVVEEHQLWEYHCCDYNDPISRIAKQIKEVNIKDERYDSFIKDIIKESEENAK